MSQNSLHLEQAILNEKLANAILGAGKHFDWVITICLYSALHYILVLKLRNNFLKTIIKLKVLYLNNLVTRPTQLIRHYIIKVEMHDIFHLGLKILEKTIMRPRLH